MLLAAVALLAIEIANMDVKPTRTTYVKILSRRWSRSTKGQSRANPWSGSNSRVRLHHAQAVRPLDDDTGFRDIISRYGWPAGDDSSDSYASHLYTSARTTPVLHDRLLAQPRRQHEASAMC